MQNSNDSDNKILTSNETSKKECECDNAWPLSVLTEEKAQKWQIEKKCYDEICDYLKEVDDILNLIKPFPREKNISEGAEQENIKPTESDSKNQTSESTRNHLENIIKLIEKLKELQDKSYSQRGKSYFGKDLTKLREHKKKLKSEKLKKLIKEESERQFISDFPTELETEYPELLNLESKSCSEDLFQQDSWKENDNLECLPQNLGESKSKVSKWTKVKEAFHWEKATHPSASKTNKKLKSFQERNDGDSKREYYDDHSPVRVWVFDDDNCPPAPPPPPSTLPRLRSPPSSKNEDYLLAPPLQDFPSSSSSDRLDDYVFTDNQKKGSKSPDVEFIGQFFSNDSNDDCDRTRKSSSEEFVTPMSQKLSKGELTSSFYKSNKTTWGKVKDIIQTRRESLKKKPKKRNCNEFNPRRKLSSPPAIHFSDHFEDVSSFEEKTKNAEESLYSKTVQEPSDENLIPTNDESLKKSMPLVTITLPSMEEIKPLPSEAFEKKIIKEDEKPSALPGISCQAQYCEEKPKFIKNKFVQNQKLSRWIKVKRVFLTSPSPLRTPLYEYGTELSPTGLNKLGFFSDMESDELSSGEWNDENIMYEKSKLTDNQMPLPNLQDDIKKSYQELQKKLSQEFDQKLREWDVKSEAIAKTDDLYHKSFTEDKIVIPKLKRSRDYNAMPLPKLNDLSPEFRKKLNDWKKMKNIQGSNSTIIPKEDFQGSNSKIKIGEWQPWKSRYCAKNMGKCEQSSYDESRKLERKGNLYLLTNQKKEEVNNALKDCRGKEEVKKINYGRSSIGGDSLMNWNLNEAKFAKRSAKLKDFQWVEKELQKILREKIRLEQEKEKYLQKEARLTQMKRTMGPALPAQEILVKTPTGFVRFKGISQKFTKKLYEWEKARGIAPEASTFALLEERAITGLNNPSDGEVILQRSKSMGSIADLSSTLLIPEVTHYPSSLSLNDVDELKALNEEDVLDESLSSDQFKIDSDKQPEALLVEVEDVIEETEIDTEFPLIKSEIPNYTFAAEEFNQLAPSSESLSLSINCAAKDSESLSIANRTPQSERKKIYCTREKMDKVVEWMEQMNESSKFSETTPQSNSNQKEIPSLSKLCVQKNFFDKREIKEIQNNEAVILQTTPMIFPVLKNATDNIKSTTNISRSEVINKTTNDFKERKNESTEVENVKKSQNQCKSDPEELKQKIKEKITLMQRMSTDKKFPNKWKYDRDRDAVEKVSITKTELAESCKKNEPKITSDELKSTKEGEEMVNMNSVNVFVPTIRKIYSPLKTNQGLFPTACSYVIDDVQKQEASIINKQEICKNEKSGSEKKSFQINFNPTFNDEFEKLNSSSSKENSLLFPKYENKKFINEIDSTNRTNFGIPPLPNSPKVYKKQNTKETAPSIKMIIDKYNQKISERDTTNEGKNEGGTLVGWRSPVFSSKAKEKADKYFTKDDDFEKKNSEIQKSVSCDAVKSISLSSNSEVINENSEEKKICKSNSVGIIKLPSQIVDSQCINVNKLVESEKNLEDSFSTMRALKIKRAKEDFLSGRHSISSNASSAISACGKNSPDVALIKSNQFSTSVDTYDTSSDNNLIKSISAETITSEQNPSQSDDQSVSGKNLQKSSSKFDLSSIRSKFRRMRWRRDKDSKLNSVATLCRQSLLIEVPSNSEANLSNYNLSKSCPSSPVMTRNKQNENKNSLKKK